MFFQICLENLWEYLKGWPLTNIHPYGPPKGPYGCVFVTANLLHVLKDFQHKFLNILSTPSTIQTYSQKLEHYIYLSAKLKMCFKVILAKRIDTYYWNDIFISMQVFQD